MMRTLLKNKIILAAALILLVVTLLSIWRIHVLQAEEGWDEELMKSLDWVIPPGVYGMIVIDEIDGQTVFHVTDYRRNNESKVIDMQGKRIEREGLQRMDYTVEEILYHPAGYGLVRGTAANGFSDSYRLETLDGDTVYDGGTNALALTEQPGYVRIVHGGVVSLDTMETVYSPKEGESITDQKGDYWVMSVEIPWQGGIKTLKYLRNMDFTAAFDGMLFESVLDIQDDIVVGKVVNGYSCDNLPEYKEGQTKITAVWKVLDGKGNILFPVKDDDMGKEIISADDGFFTTEENEFVRIHFLDNLPEDEEAIDLESGQTPRIMSENGYITFSQSSFNDGSVENGEKYGIMDRRGNVIFAPIFVRPRRVEGDLLVARFPNACGVIRIGGGRDEG